MLAKAADVMNSKDRKEGSFILSVQECTKNVVYTNYSGICRTENGGQSCVLNIKATLSIRRSLDKNEMERLSVIESCSEIVKISADCNLNHGKQPDVLKQK